MPARLLLVRSEEAVLLRPQSYTLSRHEYLLWGLPNHLLLLECIPISKQGLRPNIKVQTFAHTITLQNFNFSLLLEEKNRILTC